MDNNKTSFSSNNNNFGFLTMLLLVGILSPLLLIPQYKCLCGNCYSTRSLYKWFDDLGEDCREPKVRTMTGTIIRAQKAYHFERREFSDDLEGLGLELGNMSHGRYYNWGGGARFLQTMEPVVSLDQVKNSNQSRETFMALVFSKGLLVNYYLGAMSFDKNQNKYDMILCRGLPRNKLNFSEVKFTLINQDNQIWQCPRGTEEIP